MRKKKTSVKTGLERGLTSYGDEAFSAYMRRAFAKSMGFSGEALGKPVIGICNTFSEFNNCHRHFPELVAAVKRGVWQAGGLPLEFPTLSLGEMFLNPTSMIYRNLMAMATEELITAQPMDGVVMLGGCDKTLPAMLMAAASADIPAAFVAAGSMMTGRWRGERLGACTDCRRFWASHRAGELSAQEIQEVEDNLVPTSGTCMVMGTASTMACLTEALGLMLPGGSTPPAVTANRLRTAEETGKEIVRMVAADLRPSRLLTKKSFENAVMTQLALGGSTNGVIHLLAVARRAGVKLSLDDYDRLGRKIPLLLDLKPSGAGYMEDFEASGGLPALLKQIEKHLHTGARLLTGQTWADVLKNVSTVGHPSSVVRPLDKPLKPAPTLVVLRGNLAPDGAILKVSAASPHLHQHRGPACVFENLDDLARRVDDPKLNVSENAVLVLKNAGSVGAPGMPEAGYIPIPKKLAQAGVKDMVRVSDARMSGTAFGATVLHIDPEAAVGGPLALVQDGDEIEVDVKGRALTLHVSGKELARRRKALATQPSTVAHFSRGYKKLFTEHVLPPHLGCDFDFL